MTADAATEKGRKLQIIVLGDRAVGKTSILRRFNDAEFALTIYPTVGIDFVKKDIMLGKRRVSVQIWDTAGQERYHTIAHTFYKQCQGVLLVFDVSSRKSFDNIHKWLNNLKKHADASIIKYLVGNKVDAGRREVQSADAEKVARDYGMKYFETSAMLNKNIKECITSIAGDIYDKPPSQIHGESLAVEKACGKRGKNGCC